MRKLAKISMAGILAMLVLTLAVPAQAFTLEISPRILKNWTALTGQALPQVLGEKILAQEGMNVPPADQQQPPMGNQPYQDPNREQQPQLPQPGNTCMVNGKEMPGDCSQYNNNQGGQNQNNQSDQPWAGMCQNNTALACVNSDGKVVSSPKVDANRNPVCPADSSAQCGNYQQGNQEGQNNQGMGNGNMNGQPGGMNPKDQERMMNQMKNDVTRMETQLARLERNIIAAEKKGIIVADMKEKLAKVKETMALLKNAKTGDELQAIDIGGLNSDLMELEQEYNKQVQQAQQLKNIQKEMKNFENNFKRIETILKTLTKQKIVVPVEVTANIAEIKTIVAAVKVAKNWVEVEAAGFDKISELMDTFQQNQKLLDMLSQSSRVLKQTKAELNKLKVANKQDKDIVRRLIPKGIDLSKDLADFEAGIAKLTAVNAEAETKLKAGTVDEVEAAFDLWENDFFGALDDTWMIDKIFRTMSNLTTFASNSNREINQFRNQIKSAQKKKLDVTSLTAILEQIKVNVAEITALAKIKPMDADTLDTIISKLNDLSDLKLEFMDTYSELTNTEADMPWEPANPSQNQFQNVQFNFDSSQYGQYMQQKPQQPQMNQGGGGMGQPMDNGGGMNQPQPMNQPMNGGNSGGGQQMAPGTF